MSKVYKGWSVRGEEREGRGEGKSTNKIFTLRHQNTYINVTNVQRKCDLTQGNVVTESKK